MKDWNEGYITDSPYIADYSPYLSPCLLRTLCILHGTDLPKRKEEEPLRYLELGFGQCLALNIHAATTSGEFWGTDFNADHVLFAQEAAQSAKLDLHLLDSSFAELDKKGAEGKLPQFDIITLHGIWSWINDKNRQHILNIIHNNLKIGGIVYVSYNALPGKSSFAPIRDLLMMHADTANESFIDSNSRTQKALDFVTVLSNSGASYFAQHKTATEKLNSFKNQNISYLAHEYMNANWKSFYFKDVAEAFGSVKCSFLSSANLLTQVNIDLPPKALSLLTKAPTVIMRETIRDFVLNQGFRSDVFIKGKYSISKKVQLKLLNDIPFSLTQRREDISLTVQAPLDKIALNENLYTPILNALAENNYTPKTFKFLSEHPACGGINDDNVIEIITLLLAASYIHPTQEPKELQKIATAQLNQFFCEKNLEGQYSTVLASPILGAGVSVAPLNQLFLIAQFNALASPEEWTEYALNTLDAIDLAPMKDGKELKGEEAKDFVLNKAREFKEKHMPYLHAMGVLSFAEEKPIFHITLKNSPY